MAPKEEVGQQTVLAIFDPTILLDDNSNNEPSGKESIGIMGDVRVNQMTYPVTQTQ